MGKSHLKSLKRKLLIPVSYIVNKTTVNWIYFEIFRNLFILKDIFFYQIAHEIFYTITYNLFHNFIYFFLNFIWSLVLCRNVCREIGWLLCFVYLLCGMPVLLAYPQVTPFLCWLAWPLNDIIFIHIQKN